MTNHTPFLLFLCLLLTMPAMAETFSCTDSDDVLHIADNLMNLPEECRDQAKTRSTEGSGSVNYVPAQQEQQRIKSDFDQAVREEDQAQARKRQQADNMIQRAGSISSAFQNAVITRKSAIRSKSYGNRGEIQNAEEIMQRSRHDKQVLLEEASNARLSAEQRQQIESLLDKVE